MLSTPGGTESIAVANDGTIYTTDSCSGKVFQIDTAGNTSVVATLPFGTENPGCTSASLGVALSDDGEIFVVVWSVAPKDNGVWQIQPNGSTHLAFPMPPSAAAIPNDLAFDSHGALYITESSSGGIWRATPGGAAQPWLRSELLVPPAGAQFGANGIAILQDAVFVSNFALGTIVRVPIEPDGSPGDPAVFATGIAGPDGMEFDRRGDLYSAAATAAKLIRILPDGKSDVVARLYQVGSTFPTDVAFHPSGDETNMVFIANLNVAPGEPNIAEIELCPAPE